MRRTLTSAALLVTAACGFALFVRAADPPAAAGASKVSVPALAEREETFEPGLKLTIASNGATDNRIARLVALRVADGAPPSPFLAPGKFTATWEGVLTLRIKDEYAFVAHGNGAVKVTINDEIALDAAGDDLAARPGSMVKLKKGKNPLKVEYTSPPAGDAAVRLLWFGKSFIPESVPTTVFTHDAADKPLREQQRLRAGRELVANLRCLKCHTDAGIPTGDAAAMKELAADTPDLTDIGQRVSQAWLAHWINNPHAMRPDTEMPRVFHADGETVAQEARDIAAYLVELSAKPPAAEEPSSPESIAHGARLFTNLGCVACHVLPGEENPTETATTRISLKYVKHKFQPGALKAFIQKPEAHYAWVRMPNFRLSDDEATALSAFLRSRSAGELAGDTSGDAARGKALFQSSGCINCHTVKLENTAKPPALAQLTDWTRGCMATDPAGRGRAPAFALRDNDRAAIEAMASTAFASMKRDTPAEFGARQIAALNCLSCHPRDKQDDTWSGLTAEIDALLKEFPAEAPAPDESEITGDQVRPPLTWTGEKLRPQWAEQFIGGNLSYKPRPWLAARMPGFPARGKLLADGFAEEHGTAPVAPEPAAANPDLANVGRELSGRNGGFACVQCHAVGEQKAFSPFEAPAINFAHVSERLHKEYYDRWVYNPQRVQPGTRMPQFADVEGKTSLKNHFDGDARKQFDAIWNYLLEGKKIEPPKN